MGFSCNKPKGEQGSNASPQPAIANVPSVSTVPAGGERPVVMIETSLGTIKIELDAEKAPKTVANFLRYVDDGFYDGTIFHRTIPDFMIQGGGFTRDMKEKEAHAPIANEAGNGLKNLRGTIAMARTGDPDSATAQFFINVADNAQLNHTGNEPPEFGYAVFGKVVAGMDVVDKIKDVQTHTVVPKVFENVPVEPVVIKSVKRQPPATSQ